MLTWEKFNVNNENKTKSFEQLCRLLFKENFCNGSIVLCSSPNHKGIEADPVKDKDGKLIGFQAKYFENRVNYSQIKRSFLEIAKEYSGELDILYLYSNKDISKNSKSYKECLQILSDVGISCVEITNDELLGYAAESDMASALFFNNKKIDFDWFYNITYKNLESLSKRFNKKFNAITETERQLAIFCESELSDKILSERVKTFLYKIQYYYGQSHRDLLERISKDILEFGEITKTKEFINLNNFIKKEYSTDYYELRDALKRINEDIFQGIFDKEEREKKISIRRDIESTIELIDSLLLSDLEDQFVNNKVLFLTGKAGVGKSHTFAISANNLLRENRPVILMLGYSFLENRLIEKQLMDLLDWPEANISTLLNSFEAVGRLIEKPIIVFFDGINEMSNLKLWGAAIHDIYYKIIEYQYIKVAFSFRKGFESQLISENIKKLIDKGYITSIYHEGLDSFNYEQINIFLDNYNIPFSPSFYFNEQMSNPLFLTLFCENYDGNDIDIQNMFDNMLNKIDRDSKNEINFAENFNLLKEFINQFIRKMLDGNRWSVPKTDVFSMLFWDENGIVNKHKYVGALIRCGLLNEISYRDTIEYTFTYNLLRDFLIGKEIFINSKNFKELEENVLEILKKDNNLIEPIIFTSEMGYEFYKEELILLVLQYIFKKNEMLAENVANRFIESYTIRKSKNISIDILHKIVENYPILVETFFGMLVDNSIKQDNPTNAEFLYQKLSQLSLVERDSIWTKFINGKTDDDRLGRLIISIESRKIDTKSLDKNQIKLILILFSWILSSSNRRLRDRCSKAMIEILCDNFDICLKLFKNFECINDPYIIQRLYGVVFGVVVRIEDKNSFVFKDLVDYVYETIFLADEVYPDILLRDYARLIIERFCYENPQIVDYDMKKITPPYNSPDVPKMKKTKYEYSNNYRSSKNAIISSMNTENSGPGIYGDFGRYKFDSVLNRFENLDVLNCYYYAMNYIFNVIGFNDDIFPDDVNHSYIDRHDTLKTERIGKKYQWIAFYNLLARIFDNYIVRNDYADLCGFSGPWDPYIRNFDPTINCRIEVPANLIQFDNLNVQEENDFIDDFNVYEDEIVNWANRSSNLFENIENHLTIKDDKGNDWIVLNHIKKIEKNEKMVSKYNGKRQEIFNIMQAYFVKAQDYDICLEDIHDSNFYGRHYPEVHRIYNFFNREYYWSSVLKKYILESEWSPIEIDTGEYIEEKVPNYSFHLKDLMSEKDYSENVIKFITIKKPIKKEIYHVLPAVNDFIYESQYDGSLVENSLSFTIPNSEIFEELKLKQRELDGFFYVEDDLVALDSKLIGEDYGFIIRKDFLVEFLENKNYKMFWTLIGEKSFIISDISQIWSKWSGFANFNTDFDIKGEMFLKTDGKPNKSD